MAKTRKRRQPKKGPLPIPKKDKIYKRKRSFAEKFLIVMGIIIAISMVLSLFLFTGGGGF